MNSSFLLILTLLTIYLITLYLCLCVFRYAGEKELFHSLKSVMLFAFISILPALNIFLLIYSFSFFTFRRMDKRGINFNEFAKNFLKSKKAIKMQREKDKFTGKLGK